MWLTRLWLIVLAGAVTVTLALLLLVPRPASKDLEQTQYQRLDQAQNSTELLLQLEAREWIDRATGLARDATLAEVLEQATDRSRDAALLRERARARLLELLKQFPPARRPELAVLVDARGKIVERIAPAETEKKLRAGEDGLAGYPLVEAALRGYLRDDTWSLDGALYLMAATPVIAQARGRYVGALLLGEEINNSFATQLKGRLGGVDVAFYLRGRMVASTVVSSTLAKLPITYSRSKEQLAKRGRLPLDLGAAEAQRVVVAPMRGEAGHHEAFYSVIAPPSPAVLGVGAALARVGGADYAQLPWILLAGSLVALLVIGLLLVHFEWGSPLNQFFVELRKLARGESARMPPEGARGALVEVVQLINEAVERRGARKAAPVATGVGGPALPAAPSMIEPSHNVMPRLASSPAKPLSGFGENLELVGAGSASPLRGHDDDAPALPLRPMAAPAVRELPGLDEEERATELDHYRDAPAMPQATFDDGPVVKAPVLEVGVTTTPLQTESSSLDLLPRQPRPPSGQIDTLDPFAFDAPLAEPDTGPLKLARKPEDDTVMSSVPQQLAREAETEDPELETYFRQVYKDFLAIKRQCGESTQNITYEKFVGKLRKNRQGLLERYGCKSVKFQVYIKDGKAALKATPIKE